MKKSQISHVFTFLMIIIVIGMLVLVAYKGIVWIMNSQCEQNSAAFERNLIEFIDEYSDRGMVREEILSAPCEATQICFIDSSYCPRDSSQIADIDFGGDSVIASAANDCTANIFVKGKYTLPLGSKADLGLSGEPFQCFDVTRGKIKLLFSGTGRKSIVSIAPITELPRERNSEITTPTTPPASPETPPVNPNACNSECISSGSKQCSSTTSYRTCGNYDADTCLEWNTPTVCPSGTSCSNGACSPNEVPPVVPPVVPPIVPPPNPNGNTYYVSTTGNDANPGTIGSPFRTIKHAISVLHGGDALYIRGGVYQEQNSIGSGASGTQSAPTTLAGYPGETAIIDGNSYTIPAQHSGTGMIQVYADWFVVKDLTITHAGDSGINVPGAHVTIDNVFVHHNFGSGIVLSGNYDIAQNSRAWSNSMMNDGFTMDISWGLGITCARYPDHCTIRNCTAWDNWGEGISTFESLHTIIEDCVSYNNMQNYYISDTKYSILRNSLSYCTPGNAVDAANGARGRVTQGGILVGDEKGVPIPLQLSGTRYNSSDNIFVNNIVIGCDRNLAASIGHGARNLYAYNTFANCDSDMSDPASVYFYAGDGTGVRFINNIVIQDDSLPIAHNDGSGVAVFSNNLWSKTPAISSVRSSTDIIADPRLARQATLSPGLMTAEWFRLTSSSPAINRAISLSEVTEDYFKNARESQPDIGAIEYN